MKLIRKWWDDFKIDPVFNAIMYVMSAFLLVITVLLFIICIKEMIQC